MTEQTKHDRIFLQVCDDEDSEWFGEETWCAERIHPYDVKYIRADIVAEQLAAKDALLRRAKDALEITHELYVNASSGYGFARPDNPHNFHCDIDCCSKEEIEAHSKACDDYAAGRKASDDSWGIGTYCDEYTPALDSIAAIDKELGK